MIIYAKRLFPSPRAIAAPHQHSPPSMLGCRPCYTSCLRQSATREETPIPTVAEIDGRLAEARRRIAQLEEQRRAALARERAQARKWKAAAMSAAGEAVLAAAGCDWTQLDLDALKSWFEENAGEVKARLVTDERTPAEAKKSLDGFKRRKAGRPETTEEEATEPDDPARPPQQGWQP